MTEEQEKLFTLLCTFSKVCEENHLRYFLVGGTLLGAVRHRGFIPWDDDIDVAMPVEDYHTFLQLAPELPEHISIQSEQTDWNYPFFFVELCDTNTPFQTKNRHGPAGVYIDIFPLFPSCVPGKRAEVTFDIVSVIGYALQVKTGWTKYVPYKKVAARLGYAFLRGLPLKALRALRKGFVRSLVKEGTGYYVSPGGGHKGLVEFYPKGWFDTMVFLPFEEGEFPAPAGWDSYLKQLYGDYMTPPDVKNRKSHH